MRDFKKELDILYEEQKSFIECPPENKLEFIGNTIFDFTTYDSDADERFAKKMIEVLDVILNKNTFKYQEESDEKYDNYLLMVNMPFLKDKLSWGTSIRGAWLEDYGDKTFKIDCDRLIITSKELKEFIKQLIEWSK